MQTRRKILLREGENMHIYSLEKFEQKQKKNIAKNMYKPVLLKQYLPKNRVIKNYVYYDEPYIIKK